jgi:hypothetical protein
MVVDRLKTYMAVPAYNTDKIIGITTGTIVTGVPTSGGFTSSATSTFTTGFADTCAFVGIYSVDSGTTWQDFGAHQIIATATPVFQTYDCNCYMLPSGVLTVTGTSYYNYVAGSGTSQTMLYKVALIAKNTQGLITPLATNELGQYSSAFNFQKIVQSGQLTYNLTNSVGNSQIILHNLGYVPKIRAWFQELGGANRMMPVYYDVNGDVSQSNTIEVRVTSTTIEFYQEAIRSGRTINGSIDYRIYLDE